MTSELRKWRIKKGLKQHEAGRLIGVHHGTLCRWEIGIAPISIRLLPQVSKVTGIPISKLRPELFGEKNNDRRTA